MILRLLNVQCIAGLAAGLLLSTLLVIQKIETAHWKKQSAGFEQLHRQEQASFATTVANARAAADQARAADEANATRVAAQQAAINSSSPELQPIPVLAEAHQCPAFPLPPEALLKPPAKTDFLPPTH